MTPREPKEANDAVASKSLNQGLSAAKKAKQDEFYTQYVDIQKEVEAYLEFDPDARTYALGLRLWQVAQQSAQLC